MTNTFARKRFSLNNNQLKIIAMISMVIDHVGLVFFSNIDIFRIIGRISFPIFAFMIAEGCAHTKNRKRYLGFIVIMAIIFQVVFYIFVGSLQMSIFVTFALSILTIFSLDSLIKAQNTLYRIAMVFSLVAAAFIGIVLPHLLNEIDFTIDYGIIGIALPVAVYFAHNKSGKIINATLMIIALALTAPDFPIQWYGLLSVPFLILYNGERGKANLKYFFYFFYPIHLVLIYAMMILLTILK